MNKTTKAFSIILVLNLILFSSAISYALVNCSTEMNNCCCNESNINNGDLEIRGSCCECSVDNYKNDQAEKPMALVVVPKIDLNENYAKESYPVDRQFKTRFVISHEFSIVKENIFLLNSNLRI